MIEGIQKPFPPGESTFAGRTQALLDSLFGVDKIGLDPGEKPSKSQPSEADINFIDSLIMVPGTTKVTRLTPSKRVKLLKKRLEKGDLSEAETEKLTKALEDVTAKVGVRQKKVKNPELSGFDKSPQQRNQELRFTGKRQLEKARKELALIESGKSKAPGRKGMLEAKIQRIEERFPSLKKKPTDLDVIKGKKTKGKRMTESDRLADKIFGEGLEGVKGIKVHKGKKKVEKVSSIAEKRLKDLSSKIDKLDKDILDDAISETKSRVDLLRNRNVDDVISDLKEEATRTKRGIRELSKTDPSDPKDLRDAQKRRIEVLKAKLLFIEETIILNKTGKGK